MLLVSEKVLLIPETVFDLNVVLVLHLYYLVGSLDWYQEDVTSKIRKERFIFEPPPPHW